MSAQKVQKGTKDAKGAAQAAPKQKKEKEPCVGVMSTLATIFSKAVIGTDAEVIAEVAKATGKTLKSSTLRLYKAKWRSGGFPSQSGTKGKLNQPSDPTPDKKEKGKKGPTAKLALAKAKEAGVRVGKEAKAAKMEPTEVKKAVREAEDKVLDELGFVRSDSGVVKPKS